MSDNIEWGDYTEVGQRALAVRASLEGLGLSYVSASQIGMYQRCPRQWAYRYVLGLKVPPDGGLIVGSGVHHAAELGMLAKRDQGVEPTAEAAKDNARDYITSEVATGEVRMEETTEGELVDKAARLAELWADYAAPGVEPVGVEERFDEVVAGVPVMGRMDVTTEDALIDWKTSKRSPTIADLWKRPQVELYAAVKPQLAVTFVFIVDSPRVSKVVPVTLDAEEAATARRMAEATVADVSEGMALGVWPRNRDGWHCSPRWCGYYSRCMAGRDDSELADRAMACRAAADAAG